MRSIKELMNLKGRVALITGAAGHIGQAVCSALAELGASLILIDMDEKKCRLAAETLTHDWGISTVFRGIDLEDESLLVDLVQRVESAFGRLDILVNCAAFVGTSALAGWNVPFLEQSAATWRRAVEVNLTVPFILTQQLAPLLKKSSNGSVINFSSIYGLLGPDMRLYDDTSMNNPAAYGASKGGLLQLTRWLSTALAPDIRVNAITPGGVLRGQPEVFQERYVSRTPMKRMAIEEDFKGAIAYLASDLSAYVTGQNFIIDGGWSAW